MWRMSPEEYVRTLYRAVLRRPPEDDEVVAYWAGMIRRDGDPSQVLAGLMESDEFLDRQPKYYEIRTNEAEPTHAIARLHQIFVTDSMELPARLPDLFAANVAALRAAHPTAQHRLWGGAELREFIASEFGAEVAAAYDMLRPYAFKADLGRLCLLHAFGGLYADLSMRFIDPLRPPSTAGIAGFAAPWNDSPSWVALANGLIWSEPKRRELEIGIGFILANCRDRYYGRTPLYPTGPVCLGRAFAAAMVERGRDGADEQWMGTLRPLTPLERRRNYCLVAPDGALVALSIKLHGADITHLGAAGVNNYYEMWKAREIYS